VTGSDEALQRALRYPYAAPERSFVLAKGRAVEPSAWPGPEMSDREPLLAYAANAAPAALTRKLGRRAEPLLAERAAAIGFDVVYSAHVSLYGAVPATLIPSPGTEVAVFVLRLSAAQRQAIDATEPNYELSRLPGLECRLDDGRVLDELPVYLSRHGPLDLDGSAVALAAVPATRRRLPALSEPEVLDRVRGVLAPERSLERFVLDAAADPALARRWTVLLRRS
jgi:hypothetical protein